LTLPNPDHLTSEQLSELLEVTAQQLYEHHIVLDFTNHLSDRQLYAILYRDILPTYEKKIARRSNFLHWDCANVEGDPEMWLRYYASDDERDTWAEEMDEDLPPREVPPYARQLPRAPM